MSGPRWQCRLCGSTEVQVDYGTWYHESAHCALTLIEQAVGGPQNWFCESCCATGAGQPLDLNCEEPVPMPVL